MLHSHNIQLLSPWFDRVRDIIDVSEQKDIIITRQLLSITGPLLSVSIYKIVANAVWIILSFLDSVHIFMRSEWIKWLFCLIFIYCSCSRHLLNFIRFKLNIVKVFNKNMPKAQASSCSQKGYLRCQRGTIPYMLV